MRICWDTLNRITRLTPEGFFKIGKHLYLESTQPCAFCGNTCLVYKNNADGFREGAMVYCDGSCNAKNRQMSKATRRKMSLAHKGRWDGENNHNYGKTASSETRKKMSLAHTGDKNHRWNSELTDAERYDKRDFLAYTSWRKAVYVRDDFTCQACRKRGVKINAHHLNSYKKNMRDRLKLYNGVTLCIECHKLMHRIYGVFTTTSDFKDFISYNRRLENGCPTNTR